MQIVIADITTLQWRSLVSGLACVLLRLRVSHAKRRLLFLYSLAVVLTCYFCFFSCFGRTGGWYFINFYANGKISADVVAGPGWRWGYGIYALCYLPALLPIVSHIVFPIVIPHPLLVWRRDRTALVKEGLLLITGFIFSHFTRRVLDHNLVLGSAPRQEARHPPGGIRKTLLVRSCWHFC